MHVLTLNTDIKPLGNYQEQCSQMVADNLSLQTHDGIDGVLQIDVACDDMSAIRR